MRILVIVPVNNTTMASEVALLAPRDAVIEVVRVERGKGLLTKADIPAYKDKARAALKAYAGPAELALYGCTAAGFLAGPEGDAAFTAEIEATLGVPTVSAAGCMVSMLGREGARHVSVVSPYSDEVNGALKEFLTAGGFEVRQLLALSAPNVDALGRLTAADVEQMAMTIGKEGTDALFIACAQLPTLPIVARLQAHFGFPVWTSILAATTLGLERVGAAPRLEALDQPAA